MSRDFIGSKISIITKSQCRYSGTIIGIDAQTSSIVLGNCRSFGVENRSTTSSNNGHAPGTVLPIVQFANSDIEDLKIVDEEQQQQQQTSESVVQQSSYSMPTRASIHDDPAIVSAVVSSTNKDNTNVLNGGNNLSSNRLIQNLQHMTLNDERSKSDESNLRSNSDELNTPWSLLSSAKLEQNSKHNHTNLGQKSKFFDDFFSDKSTTNNRTNNQQRSSNTHSTQTSRENAGHQYDTNGLPVRQPFFSNDRDRSYPQQQQQQQQYRNQNGGYNQRQFYNQRRPFNSNYHQQQQQQQQRRTGPGGGGNRETFQDNPNDYDADFDFEINNMKFNKLTGEDDFKSPLEQPNPVQTTNVDASPLYDKKKSFFDNLALGDPADGPALYSNNRTKNHDTFGYNNGYQRQNNRSNGHGYRRSNNNNNYRQQQYGDEDFHYRQHNNNNNGYRYRY